MVRPAKHAANHGRAIFIYNNIQTNQVVYSLTRSLNVRSAPPTPGLRATEAADAARPTALEQ